MIYAPQSGITVPSYHVMSDIHLNVVKLKVAKEFIGIKHFWSNFCIPNDQGNRSTPSYVAFTEHERLVGDVARNQTALNPVNTVFDLMVFGNNFQFVSLKGKWINKNCID